MGTCGSPRVHYRVGGGQATSADGELPQRKKAVGKSALTGGVAISLGSGSVPHVEEVKAEVVADSDGDESVGRWLAMVDACQRR
jgi:hypothetical protein